MNSITLSGDFTARENLQRVADMLKGHNGDAKVYGKKDKNDIVTLYVKSGDNTISGRVKKVFENLFGISNDRRQVARDAMSNLVNLLADSVKYQSNLQSQLEKFSEGSVLKGHQGNESKAHRVSKLNLILNTTLNIYDKFKVETREQVFTPQADVKIKEMGLKSVEWQVGKTASYRDFTAKSFELNNIKYEPVKFVAEGGFGYVFEYKSNEVPPKTVALKISIPQNTEKETDAYRLSALREIKNHVEVSAKIDKSSIGYISSCCFPGGSVGILTDFAPHGNLEQMAKKIHEITVPSGQKTVGPGQLTETQAKVVLLTLIKDMAKGLVALHDEAKMTHMDFKPANLLLSKEGKGLLADFGTAFEGSENYRKNMEKVENPAYKAPELSSIEKKQLEAVVQKRKGVQERCGANEKQLLKDIKVLFPEVEEKDVERIVNPIHLDRYNDEANAIFPEVAARPEFSEFKFTDTFKLDIWGLGTSAYHMLTNKGIGSDNLPLKVNHRNANFMEKGNNVAIGGDSKDFDQKGHIAPTTNDIVLDQFLNFILAPKPEDRPDAKQILNHILLKDKNIDGEHVRKIIIGLANNDTKMIDEGKESIKF